MWRSRASRRTNCGTGGGGGEPSSLIARELRTSPWAVRALLAKHSGVRPPSRRRSARHLTVAEREEVSRGIAAGLSSRAIAARIGRSASTVSREIARNGGGERYQATVADRRCVGAGAAAQAVTALVEPGLAGSRSGTVGRGLVAGTDRGMAETGPPRRRIDAGLARDDLPHDLPRRPPRTWAESGQAPSLGAVGAPCPSGDAVPRPRGAAEHGLDLAAARGRDGTGRGRALRR